MVVYSAAPIKMGEGIEEGREWAKSRLFRHRHSGTRSEPGISKFPDAQLRV
jgi:hypothetical protein